MYPKLKYLYFLFCLSCVCRILSSCSSDVPDNTDEGTEMSFAVADMTRASTTTSIDRFAVYGDKKMIGEQPASLISIFDKTEVKKTDNGWGYQDIQHWFPNYEHSFVAIHPMTVLDAAQYSDSKLSFTYTLPESNDDAADIITATHRRLYSLGDAVSPVSLQFGHLLSLINFSLELTETSTRSEEFIKIHKLEMSGFGTSANINVEPASLLSNTQTNDSKIDIVTAKGNGSLTVTFDQPIEVINGAGAVKMFGGNNAIIMLPQAFEGNDKVQVGLTYSVNNETELIEISAALGGSSWESGKSYNYKIKLEIEEAKEANMVINNAAIDPWNLVEAEEVVDAK